MVSKKKSLMKASPVIVISINSNKIRSLNSSNMEILGFAILLLKAVIFLASVR
jgi:hypothetical protein